MRTNTRNAPQTDHLAVQGTIPEAAGVLQAPKPAHESKMRARTAEGARDDHVRL